MHNAVHNSQRAVSNRGELLFIQVRIIELFSARYEQNTISYCDAMSLSLWTLHAFKLIDIIITHDNRVQSEFTLSQRTCSLIRPNVPEWGTDSGLPITNKHWRLGLDFPCLVHAKQFLFLVLLSLFFIYDSMWQIQMAACWVLAHIKCLLSYC